MKTRQDFFAYMSKIEIKLYLSPGRELAILALNRRAIIVTGAVLLCLLLFIYVMFWHNALANSSGIYEFARTAGMLTAAMILLIATGFVLIVVLLQRDALSKLEAKYKQLTAYHQILSRASIDLAEASSEQQLLEQITSYLQKLSGAFASSVSKYNPETNELELIYLSMEPQKLKIVESILGTALPSVKVPLTNEVKQEMMSCIVKQTTSLKELTWGIIPQEKADLLQEQTGINNILSLILYHGDRLIGTATAYSEKELSEPPPEVLKTFAQTVGLALSRKEAEEALLVNENKFKAAFESSRDAITIMSREGRLVDCNERALELYGLSSKEDFLDQGPADFSPPQQPDGFDSCELAREYIKEVLYEKDYVCFEWSHQRRDGSTFPAEVTLTSYQLGDEVVLQASVRDITDRKCQEEKLQYLSLHDTLTGLYNRAFFEEEMRRLSGSREYPVTIVVADMDGLKLINDTMGHLRGDELLQVCAKVLKRSLRNYDVLARIGGDEFAVILPRADQAVAKKVIERINGFCEEYNLEHNELPLNISLGAATAERETMPLEDIYKKADDLMYRDKLERKNRVRTRTVDMLQAALSERDYIAYGHGERIAGLCMLMGEKLNLDDRQLIDMTLLAQVHDLGKVGVSDRILFKDSTLAAEEWEEMRQHSEKGYHIALSSPDLAEVADLILKHHEHWDGQGYPQRLQGKEIPLECRIFAVAEAFDVMTNERPYRKAVREEEAIRELKRCSGTQFDPEIVEIFVS